MKKTTFFIIIFLSLISAGCRHRSHRSGMSENSEIERSAYGPENSENSQIERSTNRSGNSKNSETVGPVLTNIPSGKYELFSILNAVYEANPNVFDNQVKEKEFWDMLIATINYRARRNPNLLTEFPVKFDTWKAHELKDGNFMVRFAYDLSSSSYPGMHIKYNIYTKMDRQSYSKMKEGKYLIKGKYKEYLDKTSKRKYSDLDDIFFQGYRSLPSKYVSSYTLGDFYYENVTVELIEEL